VKRRLLNFAACLSLLLGAAILAVGIISYRTQFSLDHSVIWESPEWKRASRWYFVVTSGSYFVSHSAYQWRSDYQLRLRSGWLFSRLSSEFRPHTTHGFRAHEQSTAASGWSRATSTYAVPDWFLSLPFAVLPLIRCCQRWRAQTRLARGKHGLCVECGYDLRASPQRCPECGAVPT
jgi:hypothetical protein